jgi:hypothetical protein
MHKYFRHVRGSYKFSLKIMLDQAFETDEQ